MSKSKCNQSVKRSHARFLNIIERSNNSRTILMIRTFLKLTVLAFPSFSVYVRKKKEILIYTAKVKSIFFSYLASKFSKDPISQKRLRRFFSRWVFFVAGIGMYLRTFSMCFSVFFNVCAFHQKWVIFIKTKWFTKVYVTCQFIKNRKIFARAQVGWHLCIQRHGR